MSPRRMLPTGMQLCLLCMCLAVAAKPASQPNFVVIITDDQSDLLADTTREVMPQLNQHIFDKGQRFLNYFATTPICCPSRVSLLRGQYQHNHNYTDVLGAPNGVAGYPKFKELKVDDSYLPSWLQSLGYNTYYTGKFLVDYSVANYDNKPKGWTDIDALVGPYTFQYYDPVFSRNGGTPNGYYGLYSTDVVAEKALNQIKAGVKAEKPFYAQIAPIAPHFSSNGPVSPADPNVVPGDVSVPRHPPLPAPRHWRLFNDHEVPQPYATFNEKDVADKPAWIRSLPRLSQHNITYLNEIYRNRLRSLRAVDELIGRVVKQLDVLGVLDNTYIIYTSDNGYHMGTHRRPSGKLSSYEEDIRVPFAIRGPGIQAGSTTLQQASHVDLAPTLLTLAGAQAPKEIDGYPLPLNEDDAVGSVKLPAWYPRHGPHTPPRTQLPLSYFSGGNGDFEEYFWDTHKQNNNWTWRSIRVHDPHAPPAPDSLTELAHRQYPRQTSYKYSVICTNERELYDLYMDPYESENIIHANANSRLVQRLDVLLQLLQTCWGDSCRYPFKYIHDDHYTNVTTVWEALDKRYDDIYDEVPMFKFKSCQRVMDWSNEENYFHDDIGSYPRGPDGKSLAPVQIRWAHHEHPLAPPGNSKVLDQPLMHQVQNDVLEVPAAYRFAGESMQSQSSYSDITDEIEKYAVPLTANRLQLNVQQLYGPPGAAALMA